MTLWLLLVFVGPIGMFALYQFATRDNARCEICQRVSPYFLRDGSCISCWEDRPAMSHYDFKADAPGGAVAAVKLTCIDHPDFEGTRQSKAYLGGCLGCRAVYAVRKARDHVTSGRIVPTLRIEVDPR